MKTNYLLLFLCISILVNLTIVSAASGIVGLSPSAVSFSNVLRGGYAERPITISYSGDDQIEVNLTSEGQIANWLNFTSHFTISKSQPGRPIISIYPPIDTPNGNYTGFVTVSLSQKNKNTPEGKAVSQINSVLQFAINIEITDKENVKCTTSGYSINSVEKGDKLDLELNLQNEGNIRIKPEVKAKIWDPEQNYVIKEYSFRGEEVLPTKEQNLNFTIPTDGLEASQYWATIEVPECYGTDTLTFDLLESGALKSNLVLLKVYSTQFGREKDTLPIYIDYQNIGEKQVDAYFSGQITLDGKIIQRLDSDKFSVALNERNNITLYFTPQTSGKYIASGRIYYDKKKTFEENAIITVISGTEKALNYVTIIMYVLIIIVIIFLLIKIRKEKEEYLGKINRMHFSR